MSAPRVNCGPQTKKTARRRSLFRCRSAVRIRLSEQCALLATAIRHVADASEAEDHHGPGGRFGDGCGDRTSPESLNTRFTHDQTVRYCGIGSATVRNSIKDVERPVGGRECY